MNIDDRLNFLTDLSEKLQEINEIFEDHGLDAPSVDCDDEECLLPDDVDVVNIRQLIRDVQLVVATNI